MSRFYDIVSNTYLFIKNNFWQLFRFGIVGISAALVYFFVGLFWEKSVNNYLMFGNTIAYCIAFFVSYFGHSIFTFSNSKRTRKVFAKFIFSTFMGYLLNSSIVFVSLSLGLKYFVCMIIATFTVPFITYLILKKWVF